MPAPSQPARVRRRRHRRDGSLHVGRRRLWAPVPEGASPRSCQLLWRLRRLSRKGAGGELHCPRGADGLQLPPCAAAGGGAPAPGRPPRLPRGPRCPVCVHGPAGPAPPVRHRRPGNQRRLPWRALLHGPGAPEPGCRSPVAPWKRSVQGTVPPSRALRFKGHVRGFMTTCPPPPPHGDHKATTALALTRFVKRIDRLHGGSLQRSGSSSRGEEGTDCGPSGGRAPSVVCGPLTEHSQGPQTCPPSTTWSHQSGCLPTNAAAGTVRRRLCAYRDGKTF
ncbi:hypothetical protein HJG60_009429 [Phyllostomus discolor]|uniref:Uncharacterized protein n=1 Tax=Phyllostomus discolor TaxID=89673 RepID=A0A833YIH2_9CHIR|nr:hypothetical protein HJG60_009429 [Phyllostomus discolor]